MSEHRDTKAAGSGDNKFGEARLAGAPSHAPAAHAWAPPCKNRVLGLWALPSSAWHPPWTPPLPDPHPLPRRRGQRSQDPVPSEQEQRGVRCPVSVLPSGLHKLKTLGNDIHSSQCLLRLQATTF